MNQVINPKLTCYSIFENLKQAVLVVYNREVLYINPFGSELFGRRKGIENHCNISDLIAAENLSFFKEGVEQTFETSIQINDETKYIEITSSPTEWETIKPTLFLVKDLSSIKFKEEDLKKKTYEAQNADMLKSSFLANMSHEIRTPLNAIIGFSQLLSSESVDEELKQRYYTMIDNNSNQLLNLIDDIIDLSKMESGLLSINKIRTNLNELIEEISINFDEVLNQSKKNKAITFIIKKPLLKQDIFIYTDRQRVIQIVSNLLSNALKFTVKGKIILGYRILDKFNLEFYVKDTGIGIQKEKLSNIFSRFYQLNQMRDTRSKGAGLGLTITKNLVDLLGGELNVKSEFGNGSTFLFKLPFKEDELGLPIKSLKKNTPTFLDWSQKTILLAEDKESNALFLKEALRKTKINIIFAENGKEVMNVLNKKTEIDLILMDIQMPEMDGYETYQAMKKENIDIPVIAQTAYAMTDERQKILSMGFNSYISKPIQVNILIEMMAQFIDK